MALKFYRDWYCGDARPRFLFLLALVFVFASGCTAYAAGPSAPDDRSVAQNISSPNLSDQWEVAIAKDGFHHVYFLYSQKEAQCLGCASLPRLRLSIGSDEDAHWEPPRELTPPSFDQVNPTLAVDASDQRTVYAAWLERTRKDLLVARSSDFGHSWSLVVVARADGAANRPVLSARGENVTIAFSRDHQMWTASSHDGGITFNLVAINAPVPVRDVLAGGTTIDPNGNAFVAWEGYGTEATPEINLLISKSGDQGKNWTTTLMDRSRGTANCQGPQCEWGYLSAQITIASDAAGTVYSLWNSNHPGKQDAERVYFSSSTTAGETWSEKVEVSNAPPGARHVLPTIVAGTSGEVRIAWMDSRNSPRWSAYSRSSTNGGATWAPEEMLSMYVPSSGYIPEQDFDPLFEPLPQDARAYGDTSSRGGL
ncbi:MAG TPA: sialidase family protein [Terriglobales bacterium]|nr:sialidase family protein [Terriglobales bacterium]